MIKIRNLHEQRKIVERENVKETCVICLDEEATRTCIPCTHDIICEKCTQNFVFCLRVCPICRREIQIISPMK